MKNHRMSYLSAFILISLLFGTCTDLTESPFSSVEPQNFYNTESELLSAVVPVYASLRVYSWGEYLHVQSHSSDALYAPTRGGDWFDNGNWQRLQEHTWTAADEKLNLAWNDAFTGISRANDIQLILEHQSPSSVVSTFIAEVRVLRAFYYWWLCDMFGRVPIVTDPTTKPENITQNTRQEVYDFIITEIKAALPHLLESPAVERVSKGAAHALLATVYLNAEVYTGTAKWAECIAECDSVINSGLYNLMPTFKDAFALVNEGVNPENIWVVGNIAAADLGTLRQQGTLHYSQLPSSPWNGFSLLADYYNKYSDDDARRDVLLAGPGKVLAGPNQGTQAFQRDGDSLIFKVELADFSLATESDGVRILKWPVDPAATGVDQGSDIAIFRYTHILLTKAEAVLMSGGGDALALVNQVRERNFDPPQPLTSITRDLILDERGFEMLWEGTRRQDLIRTGHFLDAWSLKPPSDGPHRELMPIPQPQMDSNPNLTQNTGY